MALTLTLLLTIFCIGVISYPFFRRYHVTQSCKTTQYSDTTNPSEFILQDIRQLKEDLDIGAISDTEFKNRLLELRFLAASALRTEDTSAQKTTSNDPS